MDSHGRVSRQLLVFAVVQHFKSAVLKVVTAEFCAAVPATRSLPWTSKLFENRDAELFGRDGVLLMASCNQAPCDCLDALSWPAPMQHMKMHFGHTKFLNLLQAKISVLKAQRNT